MSSSQAPDDTSDLVTRGLSKRLGGIDLPGLKGLQNRSLRTRNFKATINRRLKPRQAEPLEALEVARAVEILVSYFHWINATNANLVLGFSQCPSLHTKSFVATTICSLRTWLSCDSLFQTGQCLIRVSKHCQNRLPLLKVGSTKTTNR